jgi:hypothetical protein
MASMSDGHDPYEGAFFTPSGGPVWHWRALRRSRHWNSFRSALAESLAGWKPPTDKLLLMGPSAGWCLPSSVLSRFKTITAIDFDPLAPFLFRLNHGLDLARAGTALTFHRRNLVRDIEALLDLYPDHAVMYANILGQHLFHHDDADRAKEELNAVKTYLAGRHWVSFHDRISGSWPQSHPLPKARMIKQPIEAADLAKEFSLTGEWLDHLTADILPGTTPRILLPWPLLSDWLHIVEVGIVSPS